MAIISSAASTLTLSLTPNATSTSFSLSVSTAKIPSLSSSSSLFFSRNRALVPSRARRTSKLVSNDKKGLSCNCLFGLGVPELVVIAGVAALVFGPKKLPDVGRSIGKTVKSFQQAAKEFETELKKEPDASIDPPVEKAREIGQEEKQDASVSSTKES
ncbi:sec-independent protein translocase protein TATA, chloroplastic [Nicotiana tabacum]|uniref:Sec-independent protein translocase protein TATA, chloroplastic n=2 Tax=Nicotiana TaxID=4085 RepID=A0A1S4BM15_TOBAC|nr:PREDICTED: sec-independent protein translocase protein TATA, chloroplastic-like [Nicotiana sylvestris]XP_016489889.1 PREDICTED: sec-independent protein translocase protein TATA, chloroplastic-like [Nicotiana tabacum]